MEWKLGELLGQCGLGCELKRPQTPITGVSDDSRLVEPGALFVARRGTHVDSHGYLAEAVERGAAAVVVEEEIELAQGIELVRVQDSHEAVGLLAHAFYGNPSQHMLVFGVSGTNGKTTTTYLLESILKAAGYNPGVLGTIEYRYAGRHLKASNTTPSAVELARLFFDMRQAGVNAVAMEVSSHAAHQSRIAGIDFDVGILTNITQDHLDYHKTMEAYAHAKRRFYFDYLRPFGGKAAFNTDDAWGKRFYEEYDEGGRLAFGLEPQAGVRAGRVEYENQGTRMRLEGPQGLALELQTPLLGGFNVMNVLGAVAGGMLAGFSPGVLAEGVRRVAKVDGRFEQVDTGQDFLVIVDYAHTPDALERVLGNIRAMGARRVITVFGCGGDRDRAKRPIMGRIAAQLSDYVVITNDNPRSEDPEEIAAMVLEGLSGSPLVARGQARVVLDRREAIRHALEQASSGDVVLLAGKGHEDCQILSSCTIHFDDREVVRELLHVRQQKTA